MSRRKIKKHVAVPVPMKNKIKRTGKKGKQFKPKIILWKIKFTDRITYKAHYEIFIEVFAERILKTKCKYKHDNKKYRGCEIKDKDCEYSE